MAASDSSTVGRCSAASKTIRGVLLAILVTSAGALLIGVGLKIGTLVGGIAMAGDLFSSFLKRRIDLPPSSRAIGLDQVREALFPLLACREALSLTALDIASSVAVLFVGELLLSRLLYRVHFAINRIDAHAISRAGGDAA